MKECRLPMLLAAILFLPLFASATERELSKSSAAATAPTRAGMWGNKETFFLRTPAGEYARWVPIFDVVQRSVRVNPQWVMGEVQGQIQRGEIARRTQAEVQKLDHEIVEHRQKTNAEISNDMYLNLTDQEEYVNPFNNEVETGSNQWQHRWQNENGDIIYTDDESYDPNTDIDLNISGFKKTPIRPRFPQ